LMRFSWCCGPAAAVTYTLSLHDALPIYVHRQRGRRFRCERLLAVAARASDRCVRGHGDRANGVAAPHAAARVPGQRGPLELRRVDRKSTRLNSSHVKISYAVFCLIKKRI